MLFKELPSKNNNSLICLSNRMLTAKKKLSQVPVMNVNMDRPGFKKGTVASACPVASLVLVALDAQWMAVLNVASAS
jgi:hypothetical protein